MLFVEGVVATMIPVFFGLCLGRKVFKFNPAITLGCCAGTRTCTAALGAAFNKNDKIISFDFSAHRFS